jgi:hypothetical protein
MNDFRTVVRTEPENASFGLSDKVFTTGSCFAQAIGARLASARVETLNNPFGTTYNPCSIHKNLLQTLRKEPPDDTTYVLSQDIHFNYDFHSTLSSLDKDDLKARLESAIAGSHHFLKQSQWVLITYGTAWVYRLRSNGNIVSNCHKQPSSLFEKTLLSQKDIIESFQGIHQVLKTINPAIRIILTVSPVRHLRDTIELNSVSKSILRLSCHTLAEQHPDVWYFPAYEIMMDDLRDYRFYQSDMIHPSSDAEDYIWEHFMNRFASPSFKDFHAKWASIQLALKHRPFHPQSAGHQIFVKETIRKLEELSNLIDVKKEVAWLTSQLSK